MTDSTKRPFRVSKEQFEAFIDVYAYGSISEPPRTENDNCCHYECYDNEDGEEVAIISYSSNYLDPDSITYTILK